jgi:myo-inositol-1(or 4)-monophosphatase
MEASAESPDWLASCRAITAEVHAMLDAHPSTRERAVELRRGKGGDRTLMIDDAAEQLIFAEFERLHAAGHRFVVISEERGEVSFGGGETRVIVDPIDGSMNAKRGLSPYALSIAVADPPFRGTGDPSMRDVTFAFVHEFGGAEEWTAQVGRGALLNGRALSGEDSERRTASGLLELVAVEMARPPWIAAGAVALEAVAHRLRTFGSIAFSLCQLADGRLDGVLTLSGSRSVDAAAAQLIVRESGGFVAFTAGADPLGAPLDLAARSPVIAARTQAALDALITAVPR